MGNERAIGRWMDVSTGVKTPLSPSFGVKRGEKTPLAPQIPVKRGEKTPKITDFRPKKGNSTCFYPNIPSKEIQHENNTHYVHS